LKFLITINHPLDVVQPPKLEMTDFMKEDVKLTLWTRETDIRL